MDKYDNVVIAGLVAQVARLEVALTETQNTIQVVKGQRDLAGVANAAMAAVLRELLEDGRLSATTHDGIRAALSPDAGKGWPEVRGRPPIVCLCGSTRFMDTFNEVGWQKTLDGEIILSVGVSKYLPDDHGGEWCGEDVAKALDELHKRKIDLADYVFVLNVGGYIGESTRSEIEYAEAQGKRVDYLDRILHPKGE